MQITQHIQRSHDSSGGTGSDSLPLVAGVAVAVGGVGAALATALRRLDPLSRTVIALIGAMAVDLLVAEVMLATHIWSARGGVVAVGALSLALLLTTLTHGRNAKSRKRQDG